MKRRMTPLAMTLVNALLASRPTVLRRALSIALSLTLVVVPLLGGNTTISPAARAQSICGASDPNRIFQGCRLGAAYEMNLENSALDDMLKIHQLPLADRGRVLDAQRNDLRALLFAKLRAAIKKANRAPDEQAAVDALAVRIKAKRVEAAQYAVEEYNKWAASPCTYTPPEGFKYDGRLLCAAARLNPASAGPIDPPKFEEFESYGVARAFNVFKDLKTQRNIDQVVTASTFFGGLAAGGGLGALVAVAVPEIVVKAIFPFAARAFAIGTGVGSGLATGAAAIGGAVLIVVVAIVIGTLRGIDVFNAVAIPGKLQSKLVETQNAVPPDLGQLILTEQGEQEIFSAFLLLTLPDFPSTTPVPVALGSDPQFLLRQDGSATTTASPTIGFKAWDNDNQSARLNGGWFINKFTEDNEEKERWALKIEYINWRGELWLAGRAGAGFLHTNAKDPKQSFESAEIKYLDWNGNRFTASLLVSSLEIAPLPVVVNRLNDPTGFPAIPTPRSFSIATVNSGGQPLNTLSLLVNNAASATVNGVTVSNPRINATGLVTADLSAICGATIAEFTLKVTDNSGQNKTAPLRVGLSPITYAYGESGNPLYGSLPGGSVGAPYKGPISAVAFISTCSIDQSFSLTVENGKTPPGLTIGLIQECTTLPGDLQNCSFLGRGLMGTPTVGGTYDFAIRITFGNGDYFIRDYSLKIASQPAPLPSGAVSWWSGESGVNDDLNRNHGFPLNGFSNANFEVGQVGLAFKFNGGAGAVQLPANFFPFAPAGAAPFSFETWFKTESGGVIFGRQDTVPGGAAPVNYSPGLYVGNDGKLRAQLFWNGERNPVTSPNAVNDNRFHHVAVLYDGAEQVVYLDGAEMGRAPYTQAGANVGYQYQLGTGYALGWPGGPGSSSWYGFNGLIDDPTLYNRALTTAEVQSIYAAGSAGKIDISVAATDPTCADENSGVIKIGVLGGAPPFSYALDLAGVATPDVFQPEGVFIAPAGDHIVKIKDVFGRVFTRAVHLNSSTLSLSATNQNFGVQGGTGGFNVVSNCSWQAVSDHPAFITITSPAGGQGSGSGAVNFSVAVNNGSTRTGTIRVANQSFTVGQDGAPITATVSGGGAICTGGSATVSVNLTGGAAPYTVQLSDGQTKTGSSSPINFTVSPTTPTTYTVQSATDGFGSSATITGSAVVTPDATPPTLGAYPAPSPINAGASATVTPSAPPSDNRSVASVTATAPGFTGTLSVNQATGVVTIANAGPAGTFTVTVKATDGCGLSTTRLFTLTVAGSSCGAAINPAALAQPSFATPYAAVLSATPSGGYSFSVSAGSLPPGLNLVNALGAASILGIPTSPGTYNFTIKAKRNNSTCEAARSYTLTIPATVAPFLECVRRNQNGTWTAHFGYENSTGAAVTIPVGSNNYFTPGAQNRGQVTVFQPGRRSNAFSVTFNASGSNLGIWYLRGPDGVLRPVNVLTASIGCP
jgi:hypothetical protein